MKKVYKYKIQHEIEKIHAPIVNFLTAQVQNDTICVWAEIDTNIVETDYYLSIIGTGCSVPEDNNYIGTVQDADGMLIWHIYWRKEDVRQ